MIPLQRSYAQADGDSEVESELETELIDEPYNCDPECEIFDLRESDYSNAVFKVRALGVSARYGLCVPPGDRVGASKCLVTIAKALDENEPDRALAAIGPCVEHITHHAGGQGKLLEVLGETLDSMLDDVTWSPTLSFQRGDRYRALKESIETRVLAPEVRKALTAEIDRALSAPDRAQALLPLGIIARILGEQLHAKRFDAVARPVYAELMFDTLEAIASFDADRMLSQLIEAVLREDEAAARNLFAEHAADEQLAKIRETIRTRGIEALQPLLGARHDPSTLATLKSAMVSRMLEDGSNYGWSSFAADCDGEWKLVAF